MEKSKEQCIKFHSKSYTYNDVIAGKIKQEDYIISEVLNMIAAKKDIPRDKIMDYVLAYYGHNIKRIEIAVLDCIRNIFC